MHVSLSQSGFDSPVLNRAQVFTVAASTGQDPQIKDASVRASEMQATLQGVVGASCPGQKMPDWCNGSQLRPRGSLVSEPSSSAEAVVAKGAAPDRLLRGQQLLANPDQIKDPADADAVAAALRANRRPDGRPVGGPISLNDHVAVIRTLETLAPNMPANELATHLRQRFYPDSSAFMLPTRGNQMPLPPAAERFLSSFQAGDQDVRLRPGVSADFSHALVGFDAASNGMPVRARVYTYGGDLIQGAVAAVGLDPSGNLNSSDWRGNGWGLQMAEARRANPNARLSDLLMATVPTK